MRPGSGTYDVQPLATAADLRAVAGEWDPLAAAVPSPFLTTAWLASWEDAFAGDSWGIALRDADGRLAAGAWLPRPRPEIAGEGFEHLGDWDVVARDADARAAAWRALVARGPRRLRLPGFVSDGASTAVARRELRATGHRLIERPGSLSPYMPLPGSVEELMASVSRNLRSQSGRRRRALEREGDLRFRTVTGGDGLDDAVDAFLAVEGSGWKAREGTAILGHPQAEPHFRTFAVAGAEAGILRIHLLELDGRAIAADYGVALGGTGFLLKTGYDEELGRLSPGLVLRAEVLAASIAEGLTGYDFLGGAETYKLQWGSVPRPRVELRAYRGPELARWAWRARVRPAAAPLVRRVLRRGTRPAAAGGAPAVPAQSAG